jgi:rRNA maturation RNase YbeY
MVRTLLTELIGLRGFGLCVHLIRAKKMARLNRIFLQHEGSTDVITFDDSESPRHRQPSGEIFISVDDAVTQARRFGASWQSEIVRYVIHGVLHLRGFNDLKPRQRQIMKREEDRLLRQMSRRFDLKELARRKLAA